MKLTLLRLGVVSGITWFPGSGWCVLRCSSWTKKFLFLACKNLWLQSVHFEKHHVFLPLPTPFPHFNYLPTSSSPSYFCSILPFPPRPSSFSPFHVRSLGDKCEVKHICHVDTNPCDKQHSVRCNPGKSESIFLCFILMRFINQSINSQIMGGFALTGKIEFLPYVKVLNANPPIVCDFHDKIRF